MQILERIENEHRWFPKHIPPFCQSVVAVVDSSRNSRVFRLKSFGILSSTDIPAPVTHAAEFLSEDVLLAEVPVKEFPHRNSIRFVGALGSKKFTSESINSVR